MRSASLKRIAAVVTAATVSGSSALASPAGMTLSKPRTTEPAPAATGELPGAPSIDAHRPSAQISVTRNPLQYFSAAISELPIGSSLRGTASANPLMPPVQHNVAVTGQAPTGGATPQTVIELAQTAEREGKIPEARRHFAHALTTWPGHADVLRAAARMEDRLNQLSMAEALYQQAVDANPGHAGSWNDLGLCLARQGKLDASVGKIEQAIQLQPDKPLYRNNAATVLVELRQDQRALGHLSAVHATAEANYNLGQLLVGRGRAADAAPYFQVAIEQNPQLAPAQVALGKLQNGSPPDDDSVTQRQATAPMTPNFDSNITPQNVAPGTQPTPPTGPQLYYPATARSPEPGASTYVPPGYYPPRGVAPQMATPAYGNAAPRYLPPVASQPRGTVQR